MRQRRPQLRRRAGSPGKITRYLVKITRYLGFDGVTLSPHGRHEKASFRPLSRPSLHSLKTTEAPPTKHDRTRGAAHRAPRPKPKYMHTHNPLSPALTRPPALTLL